ncbi:hypothetical protein Ddc_16358 [Ditylenchus destructor]|nr:hypothetical protein Ddc_16358 [Ditylenchus destructor]
MVFILSAITLVICYFSLACIQSGLALPPNIQHYRQYLPLSFGNWNSPESSHPKIRRRTIIMPMNLENNPTTIAPAEIPKIPEEVNLNQFLDEHSIKSSRKTRRNNAAIKLLNLAKILYGTKYSIGDHNTTLMTTTESSAVRTTKTMSMAEKVLRSHKYRHSLRLHKW